MGVSLGSAHSWATSPVVSCLPASAEAPWGCVGWGDEEDLGEGHQCAERMPSSQGAGEEGAGSPSGCGGLWDTRQALGRYFLLLALDI